ncbi:hypothetical protein DSO57_1030918 [Entomophthora muscae]|uniref:Uncharacterized protein n=1 Tax=Entomophthora muscae TaxID=34485 RepID=A0ACC2RRU0_9FUNG|nr:hypothetical protein DSO57_1030918 [Entomophthora muscae]
MICQCLARWALDLSSYDFKISYIPGHTNEAPNALSQREDLNNRDHPYDHFNTCLVLRPKQFLITVLGISQSTFMLKDEIKAAQKDLPMIHKIVAKMASNNPNRNYKLRQGLLFRKNQLVVSPGVIQDQVLREIHFLSSGRPRGSKKNHGEALLKILMALHVPTETSQTPSTPPDSHNTMRTNLHGSSPIFLSQPIPESNWNPTGEAGWAWNVKSLPPLALDRTIFPHRTKKSAQKPAKPLNSLEDSAHTIDERFVLAYPSQVVNNGSLDSVPTWEESLINLDYLLAWA